VEVNAADFVGADLFGVAAHVGGDDGGAGGESFGDGVVVAFAAGGVDHEVGGVVHPVEGVGGDGAGEGDALFLADGFGPAVEAGDLFLQFSFEAEFAAGAADEDEFERAAGFLQVWHGLDKSVETFKAL